MAPPGGVGMVSCGLLRSPAVSCGFQADPHVVVVVVVATLNRSASLAVTGAMLIYRSR